MVNEFEYDKSKDNKIESARALLLIARELKRANDIKLSEVVSNGNSEDFFRMYQAGGWK